MSASLTLDEYEGQEVLVLNLKGAQNFRTALTHAKKTPGSRPVPDYKGDGWRWIFPAKKHLATRLMHLINPQPDDTVLAWVREAAVRVADELSARLPKDAELHSPQGPRLFPFQRPAVDFMARQRRVLLADDMGLGKTIEAIVAIDEWRERLGAALRDPRPAWQRAALERQHLLAAPKLVIAGTSKLGDWAREIEKWDPGAQVEVVPGDWPAPKRRRALDAFAAHARQEAGLWLVVNHEQLRAQKDELGDWQLKEPWFAAGEWLALVGDEAHRFKNPEAQQSRGAAMVRSHLTYLLTGTPILNNPAEIWMPLSILYPDIYGEDPGGHKGTVTYWQFYFTYVESYPVEGRGRIETGVKNEEEFRFELADKMVRRSKRILIEQGILPPKLPAVQRVIPMRDDQAKLYREAERELFLAIEQDVAAMRDAADAPIGNPDDERELEQRERDRRAAKGALARIEKLVAADNITGAIRFLENAAARYAVLRQIATSPALIGGKDSSGKLDGVIEDIQDHPGKQFVVFTWHQAAAEVVAARIAKRKIPVEWMHGGTKSEARDEIIQRFERGETQILVTSIGVGGEGLNLVQADTALFVELADSLGKNDQAEDRLHRVGQTEQVTIVRYASEGTVEVDNQIPRLRMKEIIQGATVGRDRDEAAV